MVCPPHFLAIVLLHSYGSQPGKSLQLLRRQQRPESSSLCMKQPVHRMSTEYRELESGNLEQTIIASASAA